MRVRAIVIEGEADAGTIAAIRAVLERSPSPVNILASAAAPNKPTIRALIRKVAFEMGVKESDITGPSRRKGAVRARTMAMWAARVLLDVRHEAIADCLGHRDPSTVSEGVRRGRRMLDADPAFAMLADRLRVYVTGDHHGETL